MLVVLAPAWRREWKRQGHIEDCPIVPWRDEGGQNQMRAGWRGRHTFWR